MIFSYAPLFASLLSLVSCAWWLKAVSLAHPSVRNRLFTSQLWHLALADLCFLVSGYPVGALRHGWQIFSGDRQRHLQDHLCNACYAGIRFGRFVAVMLESHIAVCSLMQALKLKNRFARKVLPIFWIVGSVLSLLLFFLQPMGFNAQDGCGPPSGIHQVDPATFWMLILCIALCVTSYLAALGRSVARDAPESVQVTFSRRGELYLVDAFVTYFLLLMLYSHKKLWENEGFLSAAFTCENLGGFLNTLTYALQSRFVSRHYQIPEIVGQRRDQRVCLSYRVGIGGTEIVDVESFAGEPTDPGLLHEPAKDTLGQ